SRARNRIHPLKSWLLLFILAAGASAGHCAEPSDPLLDLLIQKGMLTQDEANRVRAEADSMRTNAAPLQGRESKWKINNAVKSIELYGDVRMRYENRVAETPTDTRMELDRARVAVHLGIRGEIFDGFYYGVRLETSSNPRSSWVTLGSSSSTFGKS